MSTTSLDALQATLARLLTDAPFRAAALKCSNALPPEVRGLDPGRIEAFARTLAAKRVKALRRALPLSMSVMGARAAEWLERHGETCPPRTGTAETDAERFAESLAGRAEEPGVPAWLPDLARYEAARDALHRAPQPARRAAAPLGAARLTRGPAMRVLDLAWDIPALLPELRRGGVGISDFGSRISDSETPDDDDASVVPGPESENRPPKSDIERPVFLLLARDPASGAVRERAINRAMWELLRCCDGRSTSDTAIAAAARELGIRPKELAPFGEECLRTLGFLAGAGLLLEAA